MSEQERILKGRYRLGKLIGSGGMSIVYRAYDTETHDLVAVKTLRPEYMKDVQFLRQFRKESQIVNQYQHRNIVRTLDTGEEDGVLFIVMEYIEGETLEEYISGHAPLTHEKAVDIGTQICDALFYAHSHHLIHRDIKPQNILMTGDGTVKITDFGIARIAQPTATTVNARQAVGSVHYASPEQVRGGKTTARSDIYSAGCVLYEMVTGKHPFDGDSAVAIALKQMQEDPAPPTTLVRRLSPALEQVILKAMEKNPDDRYATAREMDNDLRRSLREPNGDFVIRRKTLRVQPTQTIDVPPESARPAQTEERKGRQQSRFRWRNAVPQMILIALIAAAMVLAGVLLYRIAKNPALAKAAALYVPVPDLSGKSANEAQEILADKGLHSNLVQQPSYDVAQGNVISQDPVPDSQVESGSAVTINVSTGLPQQPVPDCTGLSLEEADNLLQERGFELGEVNQSDEGAMEPGRVVRQDPIAETVCSEGRRISVWIRSGDNMSVFPMPGVVDMTEDEAVAALLAMNLTVGEIRRVPASQVPAGVVVQQNPTQKMTVGEGMAIDLWISNGLSAVYQKDLALPLTVEKDEALIEVVVLLEDGEMPLYQQTVSAGEHTIPVTLESQTEGARTVVIREDGEEIERLSVEVSAENP